MSLVLVFKYAFHSFSPTQNMLTPSPRRQPSHPICTESSWKSRTSGWPLQLQRDVAPHCATSYEINRQVFFLHSRAQCATVRQGQNNHVDTFSEGKDGGERLSSHWSVAILKYRWADSVKVSYNGRGEISLNRPQLHSPKEKLLCPMVLLSLDCTRGHSLWLIILVGHI